MQATNVARFSESMSELRFMCISQVLGTDMKKHFDISSRFQVRLLWLCNTFGCVTHLGVSHIWVCNTCHWGVQCAQDRQTSPSAVHDVNEVCWPSALRWCDRIQLKGHMHCPHCRRAVQHMHLAHAWVPCRIATHCAQQPSAVVFADANCILWQRLSIAT